MSKKKATEAVLEQGAQPVDAGSALALPGQLVEHVSRQMKDAAEKVEARMQLKWDAERRERDKWKVEDSRTRFRHDLISRVAAAWIGEGAVGKRMEARQVADLSIEYADAIMAKLDEEMAKRAKEEVDSAQRRAEHERRIHEAQVTDADCNPLEGQVTP